MKHNNVRPKHERGKGEGVLVTPTVINEGGGNRSTTRRYNQATRKDVGSGRGDVASREAEESVAGKRGEGVANDLARAEETGKRPGLGDNEPRARKSNWNRADRAGR